MKKSETGKTGVQGKDDRKAALSAALKANLARRKTQAKVRKAGKPQDQ